jgi:hypothetical protein
MATSESSGHPLSSNSPRNMIAAVDLVSGCCVMNELNEATVGCCFRSYCVTLADRPAASLGGVLHERRLVLPRQAHKRLYPVAVRRTGRRIAVNQRRDGPAHATLFLLVLDEPHGHGSTGRYAASVLASGPARKLFNIRGTTYRFPVRTSSARGRVVVERYNPSSP